jgi:hypothetical protein
MEVTLHCYRITSGLTGFNYNGLKSSLNKGEATSRSLSIYPYLQSTYILLQVLKRPVVRLNLQRGWIPCTAVAETVDPIVI